jgi:hypothetical protein
LIGRQGGRRLSIARRVAKAPGARSGRRPFHRSRETCGDRLGQVPRAGANSSNYASRPALDRRRDRRAAERTCRPHRTAPHRPPAPCRAAACVARPPALRRAAACVASRRPAARSARATVLPGVRPPRMSSSIAWALGALALPQARGPTAHYVVGRFAVLPVVPWCPLSRRRSTVHTVRCLVARIGHPSQAGRGPIEPVGLRPVGLRRSDLGVAPPAPSPGVPLFRGAPVSRGRWGLLGFGAR